ncbi:hypothetical protein GCM10020367_33910 [Streptomyces sannanensis]|uniref:Uncharacterized protein n=1 Tax=Streptomyces sannanensis TaxID=285536 RepID=A0ABP6SCT8_9ACTN
MTYITDPGWVCSVGSARTSRTTLCSAMAPLAIALLGAAAALTGFAAAAAQTEVSEGDVQISNVAFGGKNIVVQ